MGFTTLLTYQIISVAFYSEREKSDKFCSESLTPAGVSFTRRTSTTRDQRLYFPSEGNHTQDFYALKNSSTPAGFEPANLGASGEYENHGTIAPVPTTTVKEITIPTRATKGEEECRLQAIMLNRNIRQPQALAIFVKADVTRRQCEIMQSANKTIYPCYY